jgi:hypothetical protein
MPEELASRRPQTKIFVVAAIVIFDVTETVFGMFTIGRDKNDQTMRVVG